MPTYIYKAKKGPDEIVQGEMEANSRESAVAKLVDTGLSPVSVVEKGTDRSLFEGERVMPKAKGQSLECVGRSPKAMGLWGAGRIGFGDHQVGRARSLGSAAGPWPIGRRRSLSSL